MNASFSRTDAGSKVHHLPWMESSCADSYGGHHTPHCRQVEQNNLYQWTNESFLDESNFGILALRKSLNLTSPHMMSAAPASKCERPTVHRLASHEPRGVQHVSSEHVRDVHCTATAVSPTADTNLSGSHVCVAHVGNASQQCSNVHSSALQSIVLGAQGDDLPIQAVDQGVLVASARCATHRKGGKTQNQASAGER